MQSVLILACINSGSTSRSLFFNNDRFLYYRPCKLVVVKVGVGHVTMLL